MTYLHLNINDNVRLIFTLQKNEKTQNKFENLTELEEILSKI